MYFSLRVALGLISCFALFMFAAIGWPLPQSHKIGSARLMPLAAWQKHFQIIAGRDQGKVVPLIFRHIPARENRWKLILGDYAAVFLASDPEGALLVERLELFKSRKVILYEPALPILPNGSSRRSARRQGRFDPAIGCHGLAQLVHGAHRGQRHHRARRRTGSA